MQSRASREGLPEKVPKIKKQYVKTIYDSLKSQMDNTLARRLDWELENCHALTQVYEESLDCKSDISERLLQLDATKHFLYGKQQEKSKQSQETDFLKQQNRQLKHSLEKSRELISQLQQQHRLLRNNTETLIFAKDHQIQQLTDQLSNQQLIALQETQQLNQTLRHLQQQNLQFVVISNQKKRRNSILEQELKVLEQMARDNRRKVKRMSQRISIGGSQILFDLSKMREQITLSEQKQSVSEPSQESSLNQKDFDQFLKQKVQNKNSEQQIQNLGKIVTECFNAKESQQKHCSKSKSVRFLEEVKVVCSRDKLPRKSSFAHSSNNRTSICAGQNAHKKVSNTKKIISIRNKTKKEVECQKENSLKNEPKPCNIEKETKQFTVLENDSKVQQPRLRLGANRRSLTMYPLGEKESEKALIQKVQKVKKLFNITSIQKEQYYKNVGFIIVSLSSQKSKVMLQLSQLSFQIAQLRYTNQCMRKQVAQIKILINQDAGQMIRQMQKVSQKNQLERVSLFDELGVVYLDGLLDQTIDSIIQTELVSDCESAHRKQKQTNDYLLGEIHTLNSQLKDSNKSNARHEQQIFHHKSQIEHLQEQLCQINLSQQRSLSYIQILKQEIDCKQAQNVKLEQKGSENLILIEDLKARLNQILELFQKSKQKNAQLLGINEQKQQSNTELKQKLKNQRKLCVHFRQLITQKENFKPQEPERKNSEDQLKLIKSASSTLNYNRFTRNQDKQTPTEMERQPMRIRLKTKYLSEQQIAYLGFRK